MGTQNLTVRSIEGLKPGRTRYEVFDALTPGLAIRVTPSGHKSWVLFYRHHGRLRPADARPLSRSRACRRTQGGAERTRAHP